MLGGATPDRLKQIGHEALLRSILNEVCESVSASDSGIRPYIASRILDAATKGEMNP